MIYWSAALSNPNDFRTNVQSGLTISEMWLKQRGRTRDRREPGRLEKLQHEERLSGIFKRVFRKQQRQVIEQLRARYPGRKVMDISAGLLLDDNWDEEDIGELIRILLNAVKGGITLFGKTNPLEIDYQLVNVQAIKWARDYAYDLVRNINQTTVSLLRNAISAFVETPGFRIRDVVDLVSPAFGEDRALKISVTEITRAYAEGNAQAGRELQREFPDIPVMEYWYTNNDDKVCEICGPLDKMPVGLNEPFTADIYRPPAHPNCRCWTEVTTDITRITP